MHPSKNRYRLARKLALLLLSLTLNSAHAQITNVGIGYQVANDWGAGFTANWYVTNNSTTTITNWVLEFDQPITSYANTWNCTSLGSGIAGHQVITNAGYNATIAPGAMVTFGYQAAPGGLTAPTNYVLNGVVLSGNGGTGSSVPALSIANASASRAGSGTANLAFHVTLSAATTNPVTASYATADGTALAGTDYTAAAGTVSFAAGVTQQIVNVTVLGRTATVARQTLTVTLSKATNATLAASTATGTIVNQSVTPILTVSSPSLYAPSTGTNAVSFTFSLNTTSSVPVSVHAVTSNLTAAAGIDYLAATQTVTFAAGQTQQTVGIGILGSTNTGPAKTFALNLSNPSGLVLGTTQAVATIYYNSGAVTGKTPTGPFSYAEALQKAVFFYECQRSGPLPVGNRVSWRGDTATTDGSDVGLDLTGGWFDAGDHVKFGLPMAGSATLLAWGGIEYSNAYAQSGQMNYLLDNLKWVCDYFIKCDVLDSNGDTLKFYGQVGQGSADHAWWGPPEVMTMARPSYAVTRTSPGSDLCGETAAALAAASILFKSSNPTYSATLLSHARKLYAFADTYRGVYSSSITDAAGYYNSYSGYQDELMWGALWLYRATGETNYLTKAQAAYNTLFGGSTSPALKWTHSWDDKTYGSLVLFSELTTNPTYRTAAENWLNFWTIGGSSGRVTYTPGGLAWLDTAGWGNLRYAMTTAFLAFVYSDRVNDYTNRYHNFAVSQVNYVLGSNPRNSSYECGFGHNPPVNPHHRGAHSSWDNNISDPVNDRHILYGALVGGPDGSDVFTDTRSNYAQNEPACDYNAGFCGALAKMFELYGGYTQAGFPIAETPINQFFVLASINQSSTYFTEIRALLENQSGWPARATTNLHYRYFVNLSELYAAGGTTNNVTITDNTLNGGTLSGLKTWDASNHIYYVELSYDGVSIVPGGSTSYRVEAQFRLTIPNSFPASAWNPNNDFSYQGLLSGGQNVTNYGFIPTYANGVKLEGTEPFVASTGWQQWQQTNFTAAELANPAISGDAANPAQDGLPNLLKYALGLNPKVAAPQAISLQITNLSGQKVPVITYPLNLTATDVTLILQSSTNLTTWAPATTQPLASVTNGTVKTVTLQLNPGQAKLFLRFSATH